VSAASRPGPGAEGEGGGRRANLRARALALDVLALAVLLFVACDGGDPGAHPESAVRNLIASARAGDRVAVYNRLGPRTRARIDEILVSARKSGGARLLRPEDLVTVGWVPPAWEASSVRELHRESDWAEVEVASAAGDRQTVRAAREGRHWTVELPVR
jgi:hypothetical protein